MNDPYMQGGDDLSDPISLSGVSPMRYMANGGFVVPPQLPVVYRPEDREYLEARQAEAEAYDAQRTAYNAALEKYKTEVYNPYESQLKAFNAAAEAYNRDVYGPYQAAYKTYEEAVNAFNAGPMDTEYAGPAEPTLTPFSMTAPVAPAAFSMTAPTVPFKEEDVAARQAQAAEAARQDAESRQFAFEAINDPGQYNLAGMSQGSGIAGLSVPGYVKGGPVFAKAPGVLSAKQMLRKLGNKTKKFADGGAVTSPTLAERIAALQRSISSMPEVIATGSSELGRRRPMEPNPALAAARQELDKLVAQQRSQAAAVPVITPAPIGVTTPTTPTSTTAKTDLTELSKPVGVSTPPASGNAAGAAESVIAATPSVYSGTRPITALPVVPGSAPALQKPISTTAPAPASASTPGSAKSDLAEILEPDEERFTRPPTTQPPELIYIWPEERPDYQPPGTKPPATQSPPLMGALPIKEFMPPVATTQPVTQQPPAAKEPTYAPLQEGDFGWEEAQNNAKRVLQMAVKRVKPDLTWDTNDDGQITPFDAVQVAKGWRPTGPLPPVGTTQPVTPQPVTPQPVTPQPVVTSPKTYPPEFVGPLPEGARREPSTMPNVPGIPDFPPVITPPGGNVTILPRPGLPPGTSVGPRPQPIMLPEPPLPPRQELPQLPELPPQIAPPVRPTPPSTPTPPVTTRPVVPVPTLPTIPDTPPLFRPPPPGSMPGTLPMPFNPFQINQGPTALDLLKQSPNLSPNILGGQGNLGFMKDRLGNVIRAPGAVRGFADGGEVEDEEPILTDPVGTASQMLRELNPQTQMEYEATPKKVSMKRISKTPMESASGSAKGMKMELEEISAMKMPKDAKRRGSLSKAEFEDLAREYGLKRDAALSSARGLMSETFGKPTLEKPSLTKRGLTKRRFEEGGEVKKSDGAEDEKASAPAYDDPFRSGRPLPRKGRARGTQESNEALSRAVAQGVANMPYNLAGAPVDLINMALTPVGLGSRTPVMGSEWIKQKMTDLGVRPEPPTDPTEAALYGASDIGSSLVNPAGITRAGARAGSAAAQATGKALSAAAEDFRQYNRMLDVPGASYAVKPKGGQWLAGSPKESLVEAFGSYDLMSRGFPRGAGNRPLEEVQAEMRRTYSPEALAGMSDDTQRHVGRSMSELENRIAIKRWIDGNLTNYIKNDLGTPDDPLRKLGEQGITHLPKSDIESGLWLSDYVVDTRKAQGFPEAGFSPGRDESRAWENLADEAIFVSKPSELRARARQQNPWVEKLQDPNTPLYTLGSQGFRQLGFDHVVDVLAEDLAAGRLRPNQLNKMSVEQAVRRTHEYDEAMRIAMEKAQAAKREEFPVYKTYPETNYRWIKLDKPGSFALESDAMGHSVRGYEPPKGHPDWVPESGESGRESYGHGGWDAIKSGRAQVYSLVDEKGRPHATIEMRAPIPGLAEEGPVITQIKGKQNAAPKDEYLPYIQDFVRSGEYPVVGDFNNTGFRFEAMEIFDAEQLSKLQASGIKVPRYMTGEDAQQLSDTLYRMDTGNDPATGMPINFARGGPVNKHDAFIKAHA